jgi:cytochrome b561
MTHPPGTLNAISHGRFDALTVLLHWTTVLLILALLGSGFLFPYAGRSTQELLNIHRSLGVTVWLITLCRFLWRATFAHFPPFPERMSASHQWAIKVSEYALYLLLFLQPITGMAATLFFGEPFELFRHVIPAITPRAIAVAEWFHELHHWVAIALLCLACAHATAALIHHYVLRDDVLAAMLPQVRRAFSIPDLRHRTSSAGVE